MTLRLLVPVVAVLALLPPPAGAGVTIHYQGKAASAEDAASAAAAAVAFAKARQWPVAKRGGGVVIQPHAWCEPVELFIDGLILRPSFVKTQYAGAETHIAVVELFRALKPHLESLEVEDEAEYWEHSDRERLLTQMQESDLVRSRLQAEQPAVQGPVRLPGGRIADLVDTSGEGLPPGVTVLPVPTVSPRPWAAKVPTLEASPAASWRSFRARETGFRVSLPGVPRRIASRGVVTHALESSAANGLAFTISTDDPASRQPLPDPKQLAEKFAWSYRGRLLHLERRPVAGAPSLALEAEDGERRLLGRVVLSSGHAYFLTVSAKNARPAEADVRTFFESFAPLPRN